MEPKELETKLAGIRDEVKGALAELGSTLKQRVEQLESKGVADPELKEKVDRLYTRIDQLDAQITKPDAGQPQDEKSVGDEFVESDAFKQFKSRGWHRGGAAMRIEGKNILDRTSLADFSQKTTITTTAVGRSTPGILVPQRMPGIVAAPVRVLRIRDLLNVQQVSGDAVEWVKENVFTNAASPQTEAADKAESALTFTIAHDHVHTIAHWIPATRQVLDDFVGLRAFIDMKMMYGLKQKEEDEILSGDALGDHLNGLANQATAYDAALNVANDTKLDKLRHAIYQARLAEYPIDGIVLHPKDVHDIELIKNSEGGNANMGVYVLGNPKTGQEVLTIWGKPVVETTAITSGKFLAGAFGLGATLFDRLQATIDVSTEHSDYFIKNLVAIRAEERVCLAVTRPASFIYGSF